MRLDDRIPAKPLTVASYELIIFSGIIEVRWCWSIKLDGRFSQPRQPSRPDYPLGACTGSCPRNQFGVAVRLVGGAGAPLYTKAPTSQAPLRGRATPTMSESSPVIPRLVRFVP